MEIQFKPQFVDSETEELILSTMFSNRECIKMIGQRITLIGQQYNLFSNEHCELLCQTIITFFNRYGNLPTYNTISAALDHHNEQLIILLHKIQKRNILDPQNFKAALDKLTELAIFRAVSRQLLQCAAELENGKIESVEKLYHQLSLILDTRNVNQTTIEASEWKQQKWAKDYLDYITSPDHRYITLPLGSLTSKIGDISYGEMVSISGGVNQGKSFLLGHLGWELFYKQGLHVVHITLETAKRLVEWRYTARALKDILRSTCISFNDFRKGNITKRQLRWITEITSNQTLKELNVPGYYGSLFTIDIPEEYANVNLIPAIIKEYKGNCPTDVIIVDYATLLKIHSNTNGKTPLDWDTVGLLAQELRNYIARSNTIINSTGEKGTVLITASQTNPKQSMKQSAQQFLKNVQATDIGLSYLYAQPIDIGIHIRREHDATFDEHIRNNLPPPPDLLLLVLTKSRHTGGAGSYCWFRPDWENWDLGDPIDPDEVPTQSTQTKQTKGKNAKTQTYNDSDDSSNDDSVYDIMFGDS